MDRLALPRWSWGRFAFVAVICGLLAVAAALNAIANVARPGNPALAMRLWPGDALAPAILADRLVTRNPELRPSKGAIRLARQSIEAMALNPRGLHVLGFAADASDQPATARKLVRLAARTSRRDMGAQLWLIEDAVQRDDVRGALSHYDIALRASPQSRDLLFPILTSALDDASLRREVAPYIRARVPWLYAFLSYAVPNTKQPGSLAATLRLAGGMPKDPLYTDLQTALLNRLVTSGAFAAARDYYLNLDGAQPAVLSNAGFTAASTDQHYAPITWQLGQSSGLGAAFEQGDGDGRHARIFASSGERGVVLSRLLFMPPGRYLYREARTPVNAGGDAQAIWELKCLRGNELQTVWRSDRAGRITSRSISAPVSIPMNCPRQVFELTAAGGSNQDGMELVITSLSLVRAPSS